MVSLFFGLPGCGKTTILTYYAYKYRNLRKYHHVYTNVHLSIPNVTYIENDFIGVFDLSDSLILIDEATLFADSRAYKEFDKKKLQFFLLHRHYNCDIFLFTQQWDGVDRKIRVITDRVYYVYKSFLSASFMSKWYRVPYGIIIPDPKKNSSGEKLGDIIQGYCKPNFFQRIFCHRLIRRKYYKYFDSWDAPQLPAVPDDYGPYCKSV